MVPNPGKSLLPELPTQLAKFHWHSATFRTTKHDLFLFLRCRANRSSSGRLETVQVKLFEDEESADIFDGDDEIGYAKLSIHYDSFVKISDDEHKAVPNDPIEVSTTVELEESLHGQGIGPQLWDAIVAFLPEIAKGAPRRVRHTVRRKPRAGLTLDKWLEIFGPRLVDYVEVAGSNPSEWRRDFTHG